MEAIEKQKEEMAIMARAMMEQQKNEMQKFMEEQQRRQKEEFAKWVEAEKSKTDQQKVAESSSQQKYEKSTKQNLEHGVVNDAGTSVRDQEQNEDVSLPSSSRWEIQEGSL